jgi:putative ABC transport system permease protein
LRRTPGFTTVAVLALALGIAANTAIFSVVHATLLAPLPFPNPDQLVMVWSRIQGNRNGSAAGTFVEWRRRSTAFQSLNAWTGASLNLSTNDRPENVQGRRVTPGWLSMVGYDFELGRNFREEEGVVGQDRVVILSNRLWRQRFNADREIVGKPIRIDGRPSTVVGVLAAGPGDRLENDAWIPLAFTPEQLNHDFHWILVMGRLKPDVTLAQANDNMVAVAKALATEFPASNTGWSASVELLQNNFLDDEFINGLWLLLGAVGFVLLIACANVANLMLARGTSRQRELAVRGACGATRAVIVRQFITESVILATIGGALGIALAAGLLNAIMALMPPNTLPSEADVRLSVPVLLFTLAAVALSSILFGAAPAWQASRFNISAALKESGRTVSTGRHRLQRALVVVEFGLALTLLAGGGLAIGGLISLSRVNMGFRVDQLLTFALPVADGTLQGANAVTTFYGDLLERVRATPGVTSASISTGMPVVGTGFGMPLYIAGKPPADPSQRRGAGFNMVMPGYFETFGIPMSKGRTFTALDRAGSQPVAIVNQTFVDRFLEGVDPLSQRIVIEQLIPGETRLGPPIEWQIVGVYRDVRNGGPRNDGFPEVDVPFLQSPWPQARVAVRTSGDPLTLTQSLSAVVRELDPDLPMADVRTMDQRVRASMAGDRFAAVLFGSFAGVALLLAAVGIYGVMSFVVAERRQEIGIRLALGAGRPRVLRGVLREGMVTAVMGTAIGSVGAYFVGRVMEGMVFGSGRINWLTFSIVAIALTTTALLACLIPAGRAAYVDPLVALREQ